MAAFANPALNAYAAPVASPLPALLLAAGAALATWELRARTRAALRAMDSARLADVGLSAADAAREAAKPFWRA